MQRNVLMSEDLAVLGEINPVSQGTGTLTMGPVDMGKVGAILVELDIGSVGAAGTVDMKLQWSATSGGAYADIPNSAITQVTASNKKVQVELRASRLSDQDLGQFVRASVTIGGNAVLIAGRILGSKAHYYPASKQNLASVAQVLVI
jgi:hypothetical protein